MKSIKKHLTASVAVLALASSVSVNAQTKLESLHEIMYLAMWTDVCEAATGNKGVFSKHKKGVREEFMLRMIQEGSYNIDKYLDNLNRETTRTIKNDYKKLNSICPKVLVAVSGY